MKEVFDVFMNRLETVEERISEFEDRSVETSQTEMKRGERMKKENNRTLKNCGRVSKYLTYV